MKIVVPENDTVTWINELRIKLSTLIATDREYLKDCETYYKMFNGELVKELYSAAFRPFKNEDSPLAKKLFQNYSIIAPVLKAMLGDYASLPSKYTVSTINPDSKLVAETARIYFKQSAVNQAFVNEMNKQGMNTGMPTKNVDLNTVDSTFEENYIDELAATAHEILQIKDDHLDGIRKDLDLMRNWLICGFKAEHFYSHRGEPRTEVLTPDRIDIVFTPHSNLIEKSQLIRIKTQYSYHDAILRYQDSDNVSFLEERERENTYGRRIGAYRIDQPKTIDAAEITIQRTYFKARRKVKRIKRKNLLSEVEIHEVALDYKLNKGAGDISEETVLVQEVWYFDEVENVTYDKRALLEYGTIPYETTQAEMPVVGIKSNTSLYKEGKVFEITHNILMLQLIMELRKINKMIFLPKILRDEEVSPGAWFREGSNTDIYWITWNQQVSEALRDIKIVEGSTATLDVLLKAIDFNIANFNRSIGWNEMASGEANPYIGKAVGSMMLQRSTRTALPQLLVFLDSEAISRMYFITFVLANWSETGTVYEVFKTRVLDKFGLSLEDLSQIDFLIKSQDANSELEKIQVMIQTVLQPALQNAANAENLMVLASEVIDQIGPGGNFAKIKLIGKQIAKTLEVMHQQEQQQVLQTQQSIEQLKAQTKQEANQTQMQVADMSAQSKVQAAQITADGSLQEAILQFQADMTKIQTEKDLEKVYNDLLTKIKNNKK